MIKDVDIKQALASISDCWHEGMKCYLIGTEQHTFYFWPDNIGYADGTVSVNIGIDHEPQIKLQYIPSDEWFILGEGYRHTIFDWLIDHEITGIVQNVFWTAFFDSPSAKRLKWSRDSLCDPFYDQKRVNAVYTAELKRKALEQQLREVIEKVRKTVTLYLFLNKYKVWELRTYYNQNTKIEVGVNCFRIHGTDTRLRAVIHYLEKLGLKEAE